MSRRHPLLLFLTEQRVGIISWSNRKYPTAVSVDFNLYLAMNILLISCLVMSQLTVWLLDTKVLQSNRFDRLAETNDTDEIKEINCKKRKKEKSLKPWLQQ